MRRNVANMIGECNSKMNGYAVLLNYRYMNLCVKAEPASLLNVSVVCEDRPLDIEQVADVTISPDDFHFEVYPKDSDLLTKIALAIKTSHPEFKQEVKSVDENPDDSSDDGKYLLLQMPEVDDDRHDLLVNGVGALYDECKVKLDTNFQAYTTKITTQLVGSPAEELDEAKAALQEVNDKYAEMIKGFREEKEKEIEEAYQKYQEERTRRETHEKEVAEAHGKDKPWNLDMNKDVDE